jgi:3D (Asp-Asp-Asp) domain-containing protein
MSESDRANGGRERRQADRFLADLLGPARPRARRGPPGEVGPPSVAAAPAPDSAGRVFDRIVHGVGTPPEGEALDAAFEVVALPGSVTPPHDLRPGDLVVHRALGEGRLGGLRVLGDDAAVAELYHPDGWIRRDTLVLRASDGGARAPAEDEPALTPAPSGPAPSGPAPARPGAGGKLYRVTSARGGATTAVYVPDAARATDPVALVVWIHGELTCGDEGPDAVALVQSKTFPLVQQLTASRRPYVLIAPSMRWDGQTAHALGKPQAMNAFLDEVRRGLTRAGWTSAPAFGRLILAGHGRAHTVLGILAAGVRDAAWSRGALATVSDVWLLDPAWGTADPRRDCGHWTAFAQARPGVTLRILHRREGSAAAVAECIRAAAAEAGLRNVSVVDSDPEAVSHCELPRAHIPGLLTDAGKLPVAPDRGGAAPSVPATAFRRWYITTYHLATEPDAPGDSLVPVLTSSGDVIAEVPAGFFAELARKGSGRLRDGRLLIGDGWRSPAGHDYAAVLAVHRRRDPEGKSRDQERGSGITVVGGEVKTVRAYAVVPAAKLGLGYGVLRGIPLEPGRTLAADIGGFERSDERYRGAWSEGQKRYVVVNGKTGLVPTGTRVYVRQLDGAALPDGKPHDGWLVVNDTGASTYGAHFDVFVGDRQHGKQLLALTERGFVDVWFDGIEARVPAGYDHGFPRR